MLQLRNIFSDHAIFQQEAQICVHGCGAPTSAVELALISEDGKRLRYESKADAAGQFEIPIRTPKGSWTPYQMIVSDGTDQIIVEDILFGEVWLAAGQSNMEMPLSQLPDRESLRGGLSGIRFYQMNPVFANPEGWLQLGVQLSDGADPPGGWGSDRTPELQDTVSGLALAASAVLKEKLGIPVGFINFNLGATSIEAWLPFDRLEEFPELCERLQKAGEWPDGSHRNCSALYHYMAPGIYGLRFRGIWWYQGESNVLFPDAKDYYKLALDAYHQIYSALFGTEKGLPMLCALLYPWFYEEKVGGRGTVNQAFVEMAAQFPDRFSAIPTYDFPPIWSVNLGNHPIHPAHKSALGRRFGQVTLAMAYGHEGLRSAAWMKSYHVDGNRLILQFETMGLPLYANGELNGFYLAGADGVYQQANAELFSDNEVALHHEAIPHPVSALYQYLDMQTDGGLWCGGMPVASAATCDVARGIMPLRPWTDVKRDSVWVVNRTIIRENEWLVLDAFSRPTWHPGAGSEICRDAVFSRTGVSLRIAGERNPISAWVCPYPTMALDLYRFSATTMDIFCYQGVEACLEIEIEKNEYDTRLVRIQGEMEKVWDEDWAQFRFQLSETLRDVRCMTLMFYVNRPVKGVNIDHIVLWPRE